MLVKGRVMSLFGCHLFLQVSQFHVKTVYNTLQSCFCCSHHNSHWPLTLYVLFLDNVDLRKLNKNHNVLLRIKVFDQDSLRRMTLMCSFRGEADYLSFIGFSIHCPTNMFPLVFLLCTLAIYTLFACHTTSNCHLFYHLRV